MSTDASITKDLIQTLEDGKDGYADAAKHLEHGSRRDLAATMQTLSTQRATFADELRELAKAYGDNVDAEGSLVAAAHRGWMALKDKLSGDNPDGVLNTAEQGEEHAVSEYEKALEADISPGLRTVVQRQLSEIKAAQNQIKTMRGSHQ